MEGGAGEEETALIQPGSTACAATPSCTRICVGWGAHAHTLCSPEATGAGGCTEGPWVLLVSWAVCCCCWW